MLTSDGYRARAARRVADVLLLLACVLSAVLIYWAIAPRAPADCIYHPACNYPDVSLTTIAPPQVQHAPGGTVFDVDVYLVVLNLGSGHGYIPAPLRMSTLEYGWDWRSPDGSMSYAIEPVCVTVGDDLAAAGLELQFGYDVVPPCEGGGGLPWCDPPSDIGCRTSLWWTISNGCEDCGGPVLLLDVADVVHVATVTFRTTGHDVGLCTLWPRIEYGPDFVRVEENHPSGGCSLTPIDVCEWDNSGVPIEIVTHPVAAPGDMNCDGAVNMDDVPLFAKAFGYTPAGVGWPWCDWWHADCNQDGELDFDDVPVFVSLLE